MRTPISLVLRTYALKLTITPVVLTLCTDQLSTIITTVYGNAAFKRDPRFYLWLTSGETLDFYASVSRVSVFHAFLLNTSKY